MEPPDGKNPFDPDTYNRPAASIKTMLELRAFCADYFDKHIRNSVNPDEEDVAAFLGLITQSPNFFARARAVIPELQTPDVDLSHLNDLNDNVKVFLYATSGVRGPPGKKWEFLLKSQHGASSRRTAWRTWRRTLRKKERDTRSKLVMRALVAHLVSKDVFLQAHRNQLTTVVFSDPHRACARESGI